MSAGDRSAQVLATVARIPEGFVATYGDCSPGAPRFTGTVLSRDGDTVPWWRVVRADGSLAKGAEQRELLRREGVPLNGDRVELDVARIPREALRDVGR